MITSVSTARAATFAASGAASSESCIAVAAPMGTPGPMISGTSQSAVAISNTGPKTFTVNEYGRSFLPGTRVRVTTTAIPGGWIEGAVTSFTEGQNLTLTADLSVGSGTYDDWMINVAGQPGQTGATGPVGPAGPVPEVAGDGKLYARGGTPIQWTETRDAVAIDGKISRAGDAMTGPLGVVTPTQNSHATPKQYVDTLTKTSTQITDFAEAVDDRVFALFVAGTNVTFSYNDPSNTFTINATPGADPNAVMAPAGGFGADNRIVRSDGTGRISQASLCIIDDAGNLSSGANFFVGVPNALFGMQAGVARWAISPGNNVAQSGGNAGADFQIASYTDAGAALETPFKIIRSTGEAQVKKLTTTGDLTSGDRVLSNDGCILSVRPSGTAYPSVGCYSVPQGFAAGMFLTDANMLGFGTIDTNGAPSNNSFRVNPQTGEVFTDRWLNTIGHGISVGGDNSGGSDPHWIEHSKANLYGVDQTFQAHVYVASTIYQMRFAIEGSAEWVFRNDAQAFKLGGGPWSAFSDGRIKDVVGEYMLGLDEIAALRPVIYKYKGNDTFIKPAAFRDTASAEEQEERRGDPVSVPYANSQHLAAAEAGTQLVGLIAQECEKALPGTVSRQKGFIDGREVNDLRMFNGNELVYALINAVKTLKVRVEALEVKR